MTGPIEVGAALPEVVFRGVLPSDELLQLVREQDALLRAVVGVDARASHAAIALQPRTPTRRFRVRVAAYVDHEERYGCVEYAHLDEAVRRAYSELLRRVEDPSEPNLPCA